MLDYTATYSPEDNKLRLYAAHRLDDETYQLIRDAGFRWAPKQELFVAPAWTPQREDLLLSLAGTIEPEQTTLIDRAEAKASRLDALSEKRAAQAGSFKAAADAISERFAYGQPILIGHHSQRKSEKDRQRMESAQDNAVKAAQAADYWQYRAEGVERHANRKNSPGVIARRIKTLLKELRDVQRSLNDAYHNAALYQHMLDNGHTCAEKVRNLPFIGMDAYYAIERGEIDAKTVLEGMLQRAKNTLTSEDRRRWLVHILNRVAYEQSQLPPVPRYLDALSPAILQAFAREHGAEKPKAVKTDNGYTLTTSAPLPVHIGHGKSLELSEEGWRDLMENAGYSVPAKKAAKPPILNFKADTLQAKQWSNTEHYRQIEMTKAEYQNIYADYRGVMTSTCGQFRFKFCKDPNYTGPGYSAPWVAVYLTDSKTHPAPESDAINSKPSEAA